MKLFLTAVLIVLMSIGASARAEAAPLKIAGWNWFHEPADVTWWEANAASYDTDQFDCVMHWMSGSSSEMIQRVIAEDAKHKFQVILIIDGSRDILTDLEFANRARNVVNASGEPLVHSCIIGWDVVNNLYPDKSFSDLADELRASTSVARMIRSDMPVWMTISYNPGESLEAWYTAVKDVPHTGIWLWNVWGWDVNLEAPAAWLRSKGETKYFIGGLYGFKYFDPPYRADLIERGAFALPGYYESIKANGYSGVAILQNFGARNPIGGMLFRDEQGNLNDLGKTSRTVFSN